MSPRPRITRSSGNVFADLDLPDAEERLVKATLAIEIERILVRRKLTQRAAAELLGIDQPKVSQLVRGRLDGYSTERLMGFLPTLGQDIDIVVRAAPRSRRQGRLKVIAA